MLACKERLLEFLNKPLKTAKIVVMPDFFMDRLINIDFEVDEFSSLMRSVVERKGGSIDKIEQKDLRGGNAVNVSSALLALGATVIPIVCTNDLGLEQIRFHLRNYVVDTSHIKALAKASITTALEFKIKEAKANVMLRDLGSLADFGPKDLDQSDFTVIEEADYVCLFNWAGTLNKGTELAQVVFNHARKNSKCKTYLDTADPLPNKEKIPDLMHSVLQNSIVDILSVNENEAVSFASLLDENLNARKTKIGVGELALEAARVLAQNLTARIDLHTTAFSATIRKDSEVFVPSFKVDVLRATGAGDAWDAGNLIGDANGLSDECRLTLANAASACYLRDREGEHPNRQKVARFLEKAQTVSQ